ncbi:Serine/threonine-protein kinase [Lachnellula occidentalis]|uniref:non-specific serine/threonine protein kinase n=1 Tax=Lachnellula occidentalis TaxID=215460 RepID=A0A8H8UHG5_9HELO|nr:Serine/threonine-protein kinase [Lachnellula occidentalis]
MPRRRPPGEGHVVNNYNIIIVFAVAILFLPWLADAQQQQQRSAVRQRHESPHESREPEVLHTLEATKLPPTLETPLNQGRRKYTQNDSNNERLRNDASAIATLAPADTAVAAPPARRSSISSAGLSSPHSARSLEDWEVEDFVLLATVDGKLHARDRRTGEEKWELSYERPMVETKYHRRNRSEVEEDYESIAIDDFIWVVEPSQDGSLYIYRPPGGPHAGLVNTGLTMKKLVEEMAPYGNEDPPVMYTGEKKTDMITVDANTGKVIKYFGPQGAIVDGEGNCINRAFPSEECQNPTLTIGRTEYKVGIQSRKDGHQIATLSFFEWTPNTFDQDLQRQYRSTPDNQYIYTSHDGGIMGLDHGRSSTGEQGQFEPGRLFRKKFSSPVVRVFDVARPWSSEKNNPELIILPQPMPPHDDHDVAATMHRTSSIFLNHTEDGSWYAMSGKSYPLAVQGSKEAECMQQGWKQHRPASDILSDWHLSEALVGLHSIDQRTDQHLTLSSGFSDQKQPDELYPSQELDLVDDPTLIQRLGTLPEIAARSLKDFITNPLWFLLLLGFIVSNQRQIRAWVGRVSGNKKLSKILEKPINKDVSEAGQPPKSPDNEVVEVPAVQEAVDIPRVNVQDSETSNAENLVQREASETALETPSPDEAAPTPKKKAHRGTRGGVRHKKKKAAAKDESSHDGNPPKAQPSIEDAVRDAQKMGEQTKLEPDIITIPNDPSEVSGPIISIGALTVDTEKLIGTGSNGTMVFEGQFDGREVAVKRMLMQFFDIASQETKLLRESDDHPNVIRYFAQQQAAGFLYIALELCPASLADVIEKPHLHRNLAHGGEQDLPNVLYQITNGLQHLHTLRIVHRDLKPQNILVAMGKDKRPRLLVSDFGLCKKLEGEQSSFRATTAHAAGTSGWRAPELLLDDDAHQGTSMVDASTDGNSGSILVSSNVMPGNRRATRAIDIFSLGLVFFYVLTKGSHPFDCGDRYMREVNIRKGKFDLSSLSVYGNYGLEAEELISSMLSPEPKARPTAVQVMAHPFFWSPKKRLNFLCDVSDHFEKEKRDPPSEALLELEKCAPDVVRYDFLKHLGKDFVDSMGKQRKYTGSRLLDLLRALRNKKNHYEDMSDKLKKEVGPLPEGYLTFWTYRFPNLLINCWNLVYTLEWDETDRFQEYYTPIGL